MRPYEGMFLCTNKDANKDLSYLEEHVKHLIDRAGGEVLTSRKWDDRKLAYEIDRQTHGIYYLVYFQGESETVTKLNREVELSDYVLRGLFLKVEEVPEAEYKHGEEDESEEEKPEGESTEGEGEKVAAAAEGAAESTDSSESGESPSSDEPPTENS